MECTKKVWNPPKYQAFIKFHLMSHYGSFPAHSACFHGDKNKRIINFSILSSTYHMQLFPWMFYYSSQSTADFFQVYANYQYISMQVSFYSSGSILCFLAGFTFWHSVVLGEQLHWFLLDPLNPNHSMFLLFYCTPSSTLT